MSLANYEQLYEELGNMLDDTLLEKVADCVSVHLVDAYARGREYGHHLALNERETIWEVGSQREVPISKLPREIRADIQDYVKERQPKRPPRSPRQVLDAFLQWNGAVITTDDLVKAIIGIERSALRDLAPDEPAKAHIARRKTKAD